MNFAVAVIKIIFVKWYFGEDARNELDSFNSVN